MNMYEMCTCGHYGGASPNGVHKDHYQKGHGRCNDCECVKFTWKFFCDEHGKVLPDEEVKKLVTEAEKNRP